MARPPPPEVSFVVNNTTELENLISRKTLPNRVHLARSVTLAADENPVIRAKIKALISKNVVVNPVVGRNETKYFPPPKQNVDQLNKPLSGYRLQQLVTKTFTQQTFLHPRPRPLHGVVCTVFGGLGVVGMSLIQELVNFGAQVLCPVRTNYSGIDLSGRNDWRHIKLLGDQGQVITVPIDHSNFEEITRCVERSQIVFNLIGGRTPRLNWTTTDNFETSLTNIPRNIARACSMKGVQRFVHFSHSNADAKSEINFFRFKALGEEAVREEFPNTIIIRPTDIFGWRDNFTIPIKCGIFSYSPITKPKKYFLLSGKEYVRCQPVWVADIARAAVRASMREHTFGNTYTLAGPQVFYFIELLRYIDSLSLGIASEVRLVSPLESWFMLHNRPGKESVVDFVDLHMRQDVIMPTAEPTKSWEDLEINPKMLGKLEDMAEDWLADESYDAFFPNNFSDGSIPVHGIQSERYRFLGIAFTLAIVFYAIIYI